MSGRIAVQINADDAVGGIVRPFIDGEVSKVADAVIDNTEMAHGRRRAERRVVTGEGWVDEFHRRSGIARRITLAIMTGIEVAHSVAEDARQCDPDDVMVAREAMRIESDVNSDAIKMVAEWLAAWVAESWKGTYDIYDDTLSSLMDLHMSDGARDIVEAYGSGVWQHERGDMDDCCKAYGPGLDACPASKHWL